MRFRKYLNWIVLCWTIEAVLILTFGTFSLYGLVVRRDAEASFFLLGPPALFGVVLVLRAPLKEVLQEVAPFFKSLANGKER